VKFTVFDETEEIIAKFMVLEFLAGIGVRIQAERK
jgi:hypothetical protein